MSLAERKTKEPLCDEHLFDVVIAKAAEDPVGIFNVIVAMVVSLLGSFTAIWIHNHASDPDITADMLGMLSFATLVYSFCGGILSVFGIAKVAGTGNLGLVILSIASIGTVLIGIYYGIRALGS